MPGVAWIDGLIFKNVRFTAVIMPEFRLTKGCPVFEPSDAYGRFLFRVPIDHEMIELSS